jgi:hypothetical protein
MTRSISTAWTAARSCGIGWHPQQPYLAARGAKQHRHRVGVNVVVGVDAPALVE